MLSCSGHENDVELPHGDHGARHRPKEVVARHGIAHVDAAIAHGAEVHILVVLVLLSQVALDRVLDGLVWLPFENDMVVLASVTKGHSFVLQGSQFHFFLGDSDHSQPVVVSHHRDHLFQDFVSAFTTVIEDSEAIVILDSMHVGVLKDGYSDGLLRQVRHCRSCHCEVTAQEKKRKSLCLSWQIVEG